MTEPPASRPTSDEALIRAFTGSGSESAFRTLVEKYLGMVVGIAMRKTGNRSAAEEVAQNVFTILARKAAGLKAGSTLAGWIHRVTLIECAEAMRREFSHQTKMNVISQQLMSELGGRDVWREALPLVDEAIAALGRSDREIILLRFFERRSFREIGAALGKSSDAAQKQTDRALVKLSGFLKQKGVTVPMTALSAGLTAHLAQAAPAGLTHTIAHGALITASTLSSKILILKALRAMTNTKLKTAIAATVLVAIPIAMHLHENSRLRDELSAAEHNGVLGAARSAGGAAHESASPFYHQPSRHDSASTFPASSPMDAIANADPTKVGREWEHALFIADPLRRTQELARLLSMLTADNAPLAAKGFERAKSAGIKFADEERLFLRAWGKVGGQAAVDYALNQNGKDSNEALAAIGGWASIAPRNAQSWIEGLPDSDTKEKLIYGLLDGWSTFDFNAAAAYAETRPSSAARDSFRELLLQRALRSGGIAAAQNWVGRIPEDDDNRDYKQRAFTDVIQAMLYRDPAAAAGWITELNGKAFVGADAVTNTAKKLAETSPMQALKWMATLSSQEPEGLAKGAGRVLRSWAQKDVNAAGTWLGQNADHPHYDQLAAYYAKAIRATDASAAEEWAGTIRDENIRNSALATKSAATEAVMALNYRGEKYDEVNITADAVQF